MIPGIPLDVQTLSALARSNTNSCSLMDSRGGLIVLEAYVQSPLHREVLNP